MAIFQVTPRAEKGEKPKHLRKLGLVPLAIVGRDHKTVTAKATVAALRAAVHGADAHGVIEMQVAGEPGVRKTMLKSVDGDSLARVVLAATFQEVFESDVVKADVPVVATGHIEVPEGDENTMLTPVTTVLHVRAKVSDLPDHIEVDVSKLTNGHHLSAGEIALPAGVELMSSPEVVLFTVSRIAEPVLTESELETTADGEVQAEGDAGTAVQEASRLGPRSLSPRNVDHNTIMPHRIVSYGLLAAGLSGVVGGIAVHRLLDRPGQSALAFFPADALGAGSLDLVPAPDQVLAFKHIEDTISVADGGKPADPGALLASMLTDPSLKRLAAQINRSAAFAWLPTPGKPLSKDPLKQDGSGVLVVALKDPTAFQATLDKRLKQTVDGTTFYWLSEKSMGKAAVMVHDGYAIASDKAWPLVAVDRVIHGAPSLVADPAFAAVRDQALSSANLQVFLSPRINRGSEWAVSSMAIRESGIEFATSGQTDDPNVRRAGSLKPLAQGFLDSIPRGAYGFLAVAQPGPGVALAGDALDDPEKDMAKETGLDLRKDVLPGLGGDVAVAFYPSDGPDAGLDLLVSVDDANGADPSDLARKLEKSLSDEFAKDKDAKGPWKVAVDAKGVPESRLADAPTDEMRKGIHDAERSFFRPLTLSRGKTVAWATVNGSVLLATSQDLLDRAVLARQNPSPTVGLSGDKAMGESPATNDAQFVLSFSLSRLATGVRNTVDPSHMSPASAATYRKALGFFEGATEPLALRASIAPDGRYRSFFSFPVDWSKLPGLVK